jgi:DNA-binding NtrC family response regulator
MADRRPRILIVEDDHHLRRQIARLFGAPYEVQEAEDRGSALTALAGGDFDVALVDMHLPPESRTIEEGIETLKAIRAEAPGTLVLATSGDGDRATCLKAVESGAYDFFTKPIDARELQIIVRRALERRTMEREMARLQAELERRFEFESLLGRSAAMDRLKSSIRKIADSNATVLLLGESGTGKELAARAIHYNSPRRKRPFVALNCAALPEHLVEDELFGHERGAFTGAVQRREGRFEMANGGTLLLDEVGMLSPAIQAKLLRVLETREFERVGGSGTVKVDIRLIAATNEDLEEAVRQKRFRGDLYFRLNVVSMRIPPLRDRDGDIALLAAHFLHASCRANNRPLKRLHEETLARLSGLPWPGNVRELEHLMESVSLMVDEDVILPHHITSQTTPRELRVTPVTPSIPEEGILWQKQIEDYERGLLENALKLSEGKKSEAARRLGLKKDQMKYLCKKYGL